MKRRNLTSGTLLPFLICLALVAGLGLACASTEDRGGESAPKEAEPEKGTAEGEAVEEPAKPPEEEAPSKTEKPVEEIPAETEKPHEEEPVKDPPVVPASEDPNFHMKELIKDQFRGVYSEFYKGNADCRQLYQALVKAEKALEAYPKTKWNEAFKTEIMGSHYARVECAEWLIKQKKRQAFLNLEDLAGAKKILQEAADFLKPVDRSKLDKLKIGGTEADYKEFYDQAVTMIEAAKKELDLLSAMVKRKPPAGKTDMLAQEKTYWEEEGDVEAAFGEGSLGLKATGRLGRLNSTHYYLTDFKLTIAFCIESGGLDMLFRSLPEKGSALSMGIQKGDVPDPFTLVVIVQGDEIRFEDTEGNILDQFGSRRAPKGGGFSFMVRQGGSVVITKLVLEVK
ncbi:MAG: hypothetical protein ACYS47_07965 [Planctomycetota bacterium]|jgi:hypothetical protein